MAKDTKWQVKPKVPTQILDQFPELPSLQVQLLYNLGLVDSDRVDWFLNPDYHNLFDPFIFTDMETAVTRIWQAIESQQKILIFADYDADAVTANSVLTQTFKYLDYPIESYIPDRFAEGYGLNLDAFKKFKEDGVDLVITVDCGTNSCEEAKFCQDNGIDLIITDHHEITGNIPESFALINPKNPNEVYPDKQITGVGVAYKLAKALLSKQEKVIKQKLIEPEQYLPEWDKWLLDLVAIGTVADCHSLLGENRILVNFGLKVLQKTKWIGLRQLIENAGLDFSKRDPNTIDIGFKLAPRINAAGRLEHASVARNLLVSTDFAEAISLANQIEEINRRRQDITKRATSEAKEQVAAMPERKVLVVSDAAWPKGVVGIVAGRLAELYQKPAIVLEKGETESTGSARSIKGFDIVAALKHTGHLLIKFGGHQEAAGLTLSNDKFDQFYFELLKYAEVNYPEHDAQNLILEIDSELSERDLSFDRYRAIESMEPFGAGNQQPKFLIDNCKVATIRTVGAEQNHLQMQLLVGDTKLDCIGFSMGYWEKRLQTGQLVSVVGELMVDTWNGTKKLKMRLIDIQIILEQKNDSTDQRQSTDY
ncbi:MAG: single-stranded-DNA-specific exonuclease RecJ [Candidatus Doudnabacteria bacterium]